MNPSFSDAAAQARWDRYFAEVHRLLRHCGDDVASLEQDLRAHVIDSLATSETADRENNRPERDRLEAALARLGSPASYLRPLLADEFIDRGVRSYRPNLIARGLFHSLLAGSRRAVVAMLFGLGYLFLAVFIAITVLKPFMIDRVGLFRDAHGLVGAGILGRTDGLQELLGWWSIPISLTLSLLLYLALTRMLGWWRNQNQARGSKMPLGEIEGWRRQSRSQTEDVV